MPDRPKRRVYFERHSSRIVFDAASGSFLVSWSKCNRPEAERLAARKDPLVWIPSVLALVTLYDRGCITPDRIVPLARAIGRAWSAGDRETLDTEGARKAAELVHDISSMCVDSGSPAVVRDLGHALRHLLDEIAAVRFASYPRELMDPEKVLFDLEKALDACLANPDFLSWPARSMRKRFIYAMRRGMTELSVSLVALLFDTGTCPLLSLADRRSLRLRAVQMSGLDDSFSRDRVLAFLRFAIDQMVQAKDADKSCLGTVFTQQQLADSLTDSSS